jgi:hypothetical protein
MFIEVGANGAPALRDAGNFRAFKLVVHGGRDRLEAARTALNGLAELLDDDHAWVSATALRGRPEVAQDAAWQSGFDSMVEKARPHGWVHPESGAIRAHVEWVD